MMKSIKDCLQYSALCGMKSDFEIENENLKEKLRELQKECMILNSRIVSINWKILQATFILGCERKKQNLFYDIMEAAKSEFATEDFLLTEEEEMPIPFV